MKTMIFLYFIALSTFATDLIFVVDVVDNPMKPKCSDVMVRLSPKPIPCIPDGLSDNLFDIPELGLNIEDLQNIFNGAESSGGHVVGPMNSPRRTRPITSFPFELTCQAKMLLDGGKKVSFLSTQSFQLSQSNYERYLSNSSWKHHLVKGSDINSQDLIPVEVAPKTVLGRFKVELSYNKYYHSFQLGLCEDLSTLTESKLSCSQSEASVDSDLFKVSFQKRFKGKDKLVNQTIMITCRPH